jgi:hypothetical protein
MAPRNSNLEQIQIIPSEKTPLWFVIHPEVQKNKRFMAFSEFLLPILKKSI